MCLPFTHRWSPYGRPHAHKPAGTVVQSRECLCCGKWEHRKAPKLKWY